MGNTFIVVFILLGLGAVAGLVFIFPFFLSLTSNLHGSSHGPPSEPQEIVSEVYIPEGAAKQGSGQNFAPEKTTVEIGKDNKVRWYNNDNVQSSVLADDDSDPQFFNATHLHGSGDPTAASSLYPGEIFEYTFTKAGTFGYHCSFHPWMRGNVKVLPLSK